MITFIKRIYTSEAFSRRKKCGWQNNFLIPSRNSSVHKSMSNICLPELTDLGWVYVSIANVFEDKLSTADRIILGYLIAEQPEKALQCEMPDRDRRQLLNALLALQEYKDVGQSTVLLPLDMATSALILMSAMYRCVTTMGMVGLTTTATTPQEQILEPVSDSYTRLYETALQKLPPAARKAASLSLTRDELKKKVIMPDYYGSSAAIKRMPEELHEPYLATKEELIPAHMRHLEWGRTAGELLQKRGITHPQWTCSLTGRNIGYLCAKPVHAEVDLPDSHFSVSKVMEVESDDSYHLPLIANTVHSADSSILVRWYEFAAANNITTFTTHDAVNTTANHLNQMRQIIAEEIVMAALHSPVMSLSKQLDLNLPQIGDFTDWVSHFKPHNFMS